MGPRSPLPASRRACIGPGVARIARHERGAAALALAALALGCETPATGVLVVVGTDLDPSLPLTVSARLSRGLDGGEERLAGPWTRVASDAEAVDGGVTLPLSFGVVPGENPVDEPVSVLVEGVVGDVTLRRRAAFTFVARRTGVLRVFLTQRCAEPATGCVEPVRCTVQQLCEDQGLTCGNDGTCVAVRVPLSDDPDASFDDVAPAEACAAASWAPPAPRPTPASRGRAGAVPTPKSAAATAPSCAPTAPPAPPATTPASSRVPAPTASAARSAARPTAPPAAPPRAPAPPRQSAWAASAACAPPQTAPPAARPPAPVSRRPCASRVRAPPAR